ncbi:unnamed protein product [Polarella glacialis]|uniref:Uncharacterized protein n=1 Tax=Polarella glacialis TaxID=89957 RepID=A0A813JH53_POLGL|nr:unnamed protein product [Polarella glacialis]
MPETVVLQNGEPNVDKWATRVRTPVVVQNGEPNVDKWWATRLRTRTTKGDSFELASYVQNLAESGPDPARSFGNSCELQTWGRAILGESEGRCLTSGPLAADLRCAVGLDKVLHHFGRELRRNGTKSGCRGTQAERIGTFISHDWGSRGSLKFMSLLLIFNSGAAAVIAVSVSVTVALMQAYDVMPSKSSKRLVGGMVYITRSGEASLCGLVAYLFILCFWQRILSLCGRSASVFLDKLCINQENEEQKERAILGLAGFLDISDRLIILWSPSYFDRLWCAYELASWLRLSRMKDTTLMPIHLAPALLAITFSMWSSIIIFIYAITIRSYFLGKDTQRSGSDVLHFDMVTGVAAFMCAVVGGIILPTHLSRRLANSLRLLPQQLESFSIREANCFCCSHDHVHPETKKDLPCDRRLIYKMLLQWQQDFTGSGESFTTLEAFDFRIRQKLKPWVLRTIGGAHAPFRLLLATISVPFLCSTMDFLPAMIQLGGVPAFRLGLDAALQSFVLGPCAATVIMMISAAGFDCKDHVGCDLLLTLLKSTASLIVLAVIWTTINIPRTMLEHVGWQLAAGAVLVVPTIAIFCCSCRRRAVGGIE